LTGLLEAGNFELKIVTVPFNYEKKKSGKLSPESASDAHRMKHPFQELDSGGRVPGEFG